MYIFFTLGDQRSQLKDLYNHVVVKYAKNWKELGKNLNIDEDLLNITEKDYPHNFENCCSKILSDWLELNPQATWQILLDAVNKLQDKLNTAADKLPDTGKKLDTATDQLPDKDEKLSNAADKLPDTVEKLDIAADKLVEKLDTAADKLPDTVEKSDTAADKLPDTVEKLDIAADN